jgi:lysozyme family protein
MRARLLFSVIAVLLLLPATAWAQDSSDNICHIDPTAEECLPIEGEEFERDEDEDVDEDVEAEEEEDLDATVLGRQLAMTGTNAPLAIGLAAALLAIGGLLLVAARRRAAGTDVTE